MRELLLTPYPIRVHVHLVGDGKPNDHEALELAHQRYTDTLDMANCACGTPTTLDFLATKAEVAARRQAGIPDLG